MLVIHGIWAHGVLSLWAEDSDQPAEVPSDTPGQPRSGPGRSPRSRSHPFAASTGLLGDVLAEFGEDAGDLVRKAADDELNLWLPGTAAGPAASPDLARADSRGYVQLRRQHQLRLCRQLPGQRHDSQAGRAARSGNAVTSDATQAGRARLAPWLVPALSFDPAAALALLGDQPARTPRPSAASWLAVFSSWPRSQRWRLTSPRVAGCCPALTSPRRSRTDEAASTEPLFGQVAAGAGRRRCAAGSRADPGAAAAVPGHERGRRAVGARSLPTRLTC